MTDPRLPFGAAVVVIGLVANNARQQLKKSYKGIVVRRVITALAKGLTYTPESTFAKPDFNGMHLFDRNAERWKSEDEICGKKNEVSYSLHEVRASYMQRSGKHSREVIIFKGVIVRLDFNKNFQGHTIVSPRAREKFSVACSASPRAGRENRSCGSRARISRTSSASTPPTIRRRVTC